MALLRHAFRAMGGPCELVIEPAGGPPPAAAALQAAADAAEAEVRRIERAWSRYRDDSVVSRINAAAGIGQAIAVDTETASLLQFADTLHQASGGRFDITSGVLRRVWDFRSGQAPAPEAVAALLPLIGWHQVQWDGQRIALPQAGMEIDFGGIGKEYAADRAHQVLAGRGLAHGYVNLGGDIRVLGPRADGQPWRFAIQHPRDPGAAVAAIALSGGALATSGDYERCLVIDGVRHSHILDPRSGWPARGWQSISVTAPACTAAGALTTIAMLHGPQALDFLRDQGVSFLAIDEQGQAHAHALPTTDPEPHAH